MVESYSSTSKGPSRPGPDAAPGQDRRVDTAPGLAEVGRAAFSLPSALSPPARAAFRTHPESTFPIRRTATTSTRSSAVCPYRRECSASKALSGPQSTPCSSRCLDPGNAQAPSTVLYTACPDGTPGSPASADNPSLCKSDEHPLLHLAPVLPRASTVRESPRKQAAANIVVFDIRDQQSDCAEQAGERRNDNPWNTAAGAQDLPPGSARIHRRRSGRTPSGLVPAGWTPPAEPLIVAALAMRWIPKRRLQQIPDPAVRRYDPGSIFERPPDRSPPRRWPACLRGCIPGPRWRRSGSVPVHPADSTQDRGLLLRSGDPRAGSRRCPGRRCFRLRPRPRKCRSWAPGSALPLRRPVGLYWKVPSRPRTRSCRKCVPRSMREALAVVPPMSKVMTLSKPRVLAIQRAASTPAAGPDSRMNTGRRAASSSGVSPPADCMICRAAADPH